MNGHKRSRGAESPQPGEKQQADGGPRMPPAVLLAAAGLAQAVISRGRRATPWSLAAGLPVLGASAWLLAGSLRSFLRSRTTVNPHRAGETTSLVVDGPNRLTRNPMYLGLTGLLLSHAIARRSPSALIPLAGFVWLIDRHQIPAEEKALEDRFGRTYLDYQRHVPRWLGRRSARTAKSS